VWVEHKRNSLPFLFRRGRFVAYQVKEVKVGMFTVACRTQWGTQVQIELLNLSAKHMHSAARMLFEWLSFRTTGVGEKTLSAVDSVLMLRYASQDNSLL